MEPVLVSSSDVRGAPVEPVLIAGVTRIEESDMVDAYRVIPPAVSLGVIVSLGTTAMMFFAALIAGIVLGGFTVNSFAQLLAAVVAATLCGSFVRARVGVGKRVWAAMQEWERQVRYEITDSVMRVRTEQSSNELDWQLCTNWIETSIGFYVQQRGRYYVVIPKRAFDGDIEVQQLRELLHAKVRFTPISKVKDRIVWIKLVFWVVFVLGSIVLFNIFSSG